YRPRLPTSCTTRLRLTSRANNSMRRFLTILILAAGSIPAQDAPENHRPPLFFREAWNHTGIPEHPISQESVANANLQLVFYGEKPASSHPNGHEGDAGIWDNKRAQPVDDPAHTFTGTCNRPCGLAFRDSNNYVDMTG